MTFEKLSDYFAGNAYLEIYERANRFNERGKLMFKGYYTEMSVVMFKLLKDRYVARIDGITGKEGIEVLVDKERIYGE